MWFKFALLASLVWGFNYAMCELILEKLSILGFLALSLFTCSLFFMVLAYQQHLKTDLVYLISNKKMVTIFLLQVITFNIAAYFISYAIKSSNNAPLSALVESTYPFFSAIFLYLFFQRSHIDLRFLMGSVLILSGLCLIYYA
jgi:drug/metabolite transporter (DMT)-like permease